MNNPLKPVVFVSALNSIYTMYQILIQGIINPLGVLALFISSIFIFLYIKKSKYAGAFLFYSAIPIFPLYFLTGFLGLNTTPPRIVTYTILGIIYIVCIFILWKVKNKYEEYLFDLQKNVVEIPDQIIN